MAKPRAIFTVASARIFFSFLLLALSLSFGPALKAASLQFDVFPGYESNVREAQWFPVTFEVKNDGPTFAGFIEFASAQLSRQQIRRVPIELPTGTLKRVSIPVFSSSRYANWKARLVTEKGKVVAEQEIYSSGQGGAGSPLRQVSHDTALLGAVARSASGAPAFPKTKRNQPELQPAVCRLQPAIFPDNPVSLGGLQAIYLNSERALDLKIPQASALIAWLQGGGHLVVGVEQIADVNGNNWLRELLPCDLTGSTKVKTEDHFQRWVQTINSALKKGTKNKAGENVTATITPESAFEQAEMEVATITLRDGKELASANGVPLAVEAIRGNGKITVLLFSPERQPFVSWQNRPWFWAMLTSVPVETFEGADYYNYGGWSADSVFGALTESKQIRKLPLSALLLLLIVYLLVIGPFDQIFLKRINKQMLTWITFPIYVVFFSLLIYFIGFKLRAGDSEWNELHLVDVLSSGQKSFLRGRTYASIYSPSNQRYRLEGEQFIASVRGEYLANYGNGEENSEASVIQHGNNFSAEVFVPVWTSQLYVNDWMQPMTETPLTLTVTQGSAWNVKIQNHLDRKLTHARICLGGKIHELGELLPNQTKDIRLETGSGVPISEFARNYGGQFFEAAQNRRQTFGSSRQINWELPNASMAASFISQLDENQSHRRFISSGGLDLTDLAESNQAILMAWDSGHIYTKPLNRFTPRRTSKNTLLRVSVPVNPKT